MAWLSMCVVIVISAAQYIVVVLFGKSFLPTVRLMLPLSFAGFFAGMKEPFNMFLSAHAKGIFKRNIAFFVASV